jgi:diacylglycerol kinase (ATP)
VKRAVTSILIIVNPKSGRDRGVRTAERVAARLRQRGIDVDIRHTRAPGDAEAITREAALRVSARPDCVVACGGDGTTQEVANGLASLGQEAGDSRPAMGLAPAGRCNDFARVLGVGADPHAIAEVLATGSPSPIDLGRVNGRYFCTVVTVGVDADISSYVDTMRMPLRGTLAYLYGTLCVLAGYRGRKLRIEGDFGTMERLLFVASSANTPSYGGAIKIAPGAVPTDGELDLCVIDQVSRLRMITLLPRVLLGRHRSQPEVEFKRTKRLHIESVDQLELWADGERIASTPATIEVAPGAVDVVLPNTATQGD